MFYNVLQCYNVSMFYKKISFLSRYSFIQFHIFISMIGSNIIICCHDAIKNTIMLARTDTHYYNQCGDIFCVVLPILQSFGHVLDMSKKTKCPRRELFLSVLPLGQNPVGDACVFCMRHQSRINISSDLSTISSPLSNSRSVYQFACLVTEIRPIQGYLLSQMRYFSFFQSQTMITDFAFEFYVTQ